MPNVVPEEAAQSCVTLRAHDLNGSGTAVAVHARVLMVLSIAASHVALPGSTDLEATQAYNMTTVRALREFASGTLILLPQVPFIHQIASECSHPRRVAVSVCAHKCYLRPC